MQAFSSERFKPLEEAIGYTFKDKNLLIQALTHKSCGAESYERLEFLGDSLINFFVVSLLLRSFPSASEGELASAKAYFVSEEFLYELGERLSLEGYVLVKGKPKRVSQSVVADVFEALWGAIYLDCGSADFAQSLFERLFAQSILERVKKGDYKKDYKTLLQEETQKRWKERPTYRVVSVEGPQHNRVFEVECGIREFRAVAKGKSKKSAQQLAAKRVLELILSSESSAPQASD
ncbi:MAG: ribonuclease III [Aquificota bacterium]|nr:MAG: ribonuclease III [Aquificota bacterium]